jgi:hypothetical protein
LRGISPFPSRSDTCAAAGIDIPVASITATITLGGQPLPATNEYAMDTELYLVAKETGERHELANWSYNTALYGPTVTPRLVPGVYDLLYCHQCDGGTNTSFETDATDAFPRGLRLLGQNLVIGAGPNNLKIDIPVASITATITLGGKALPTTNEYAMDTELYLVANDTGEWHELANWNYNTALYGPTVTPRVVPGTYDILYCHQCNGGTNTSFETDATDAFPRGLRLLGTCVTVP